MLYATYHLLSIYVMCQGWSFSCNEKVDFLNQNLAEVSVLLKKFPKNCLFQADDFIPHRNIDT